MYNLAIRQAHALTPKGFRGRIERGELENRFYHRLLYAAMRWCVRHGQLRKGITLARRQLRLNPGDELAVRYHLPVLLAANEQHAQAAIAMKRLQKRASTEDAHVQMVLSLCYLAAGQWGDGQECFLRALFRLPVLRSLLLDEPLPDWREHHWHRGYIPDLDGLWFDCATILSRYPQLEIVYFRLLGRSEVVAAEHNLATHYQRAKSALQGGKSWDDSVGGWDRDVSIRAAELVLRIGLLSPM